MPKIFVVALKNFFRDEISRLHKSFKDKIFVARRKFSKSSHKKFSLSNTSGYTLCNDTI